VLCKQSRRRPAGPGWVSRAKRAVPEGSCAYYYAVECRRWSECGFGGAEEALAECRSTCSRLPPFGSICPGMDGIRAMQEQLPPGMEVRGVSICPGTDGIRAMQEQLPRTRKLCRGKRDSFSPHIARRRTIIWQIMNILISLQSKLLPCEKYCLSYPVLQCIWLHISPDPSKTIAMAMLVWTIDQTVLPATLQIPDPSCNMRARHHAQQ